MFERSNYDVAAMPPEVSAIIASARNEHWPSDTMLRSLACYFSDRVTAIDTLSTTVPSVPIQPPALSEYYATLPSSPNMPRVSPPAQYRAAADLRAYYRKHVLPRMAGTHLVADQVIDNLPRVLREDTLRYWLGFNKADTPPVVRIINDDALLKSQGYLGKTMMFFSIGTEDIGPAQAQVESHIAVSGGEPILRREETGTEQFREYGDFRALVAHAGILRLGALGALTVEETNSRLKHMIA